MITRSSTRDLPLQEERSEATFDWSVFRRLMAYLKPYRVRLAVMYTMAIINVAATITVPILVQRGIDNHVAVQQPEGLSLLLSAMAGVLVVLFISARIQGTLMMRIGYRLLHDVRRDLFAHLQRLSFRFFDTHRTGQIMSRLTNDVQVLEELLRAGLDTIVVDVLMLFGIAGAMIVLDSRLSLILVVTVPLFVLIVFGLQSRLRRAGRRIQRALSSVNAFLNESISGIKVIRAFAREDLNTANFRAINTEYYEETRRFYPLNGWFWQSVATLALTGTTLVLVGGGILLAYGGITVGVIVAFLSYVNRFFQPLQKISNMLNQVSRAMASAERIFAMMDEPVEAGAPAEWRIAPPVAQGASPPAEVQFQDVSFAYNPEEPVLHGVSFDAVPGGMNAVVGETGSGKTTIINLLCRFYEPDAGIITVDGIPLSQWELSHYRSRIALVAQDAGVFSGTVSENIKLGTPGARDEDVRAVAEEMGIDTIIRSLPNGYDTEVGERGRLLSLGQRQLVAFARALLRDPHILILDEASSYIDSSTEAVVQEAMVRLSRNRTSFVIAHRLSTIRAAERIFVIDGGRLVEQGTHRYLLSRGGHYSTLVHSAG
ncbi:MAG TPA: ABC transporter ATP-binding protein [Alkalispirochaeta sp.]|nr:ABC transporter ATP-binding protein [Alkalispirochaeta sp.]